MKYSVSTENFYILYALYEIFWDFISSIMKLDIIMIGHDYILDFETLIIYVKIAKYFAEIIKIF